MKDAGDAPMHQIVRLGTFLLIVGSILVPVICQAAPLPHSISMLVLTQGRLRGGMTEDQQPEADVFPRPERALLRQLSNAKKLVQQRRYGEAVRALNVILSMPEDHLYRSDETEATDRSLHAQANRILRNMPSKGRKLYELQYGPRAKHLLKKAVETHDQDLLGEVSRRFFHTEAGCEATFLLGLYDFHHGNPLGAALTLEQLRDEAISVKRFEPALSLTLAVCWNQAEKPEQAKAILHKLQQRNPTGVIHIAGQKQTLPTDLKTLPTWLVAKSDAAASLTARKQTQWTQPRGNASRSATTTASRPLLDPSWEVPLTDHPTAESLLVGQLEYHTQQGVPVVPSLHLVALDGKILMRSLRALTAVDCTTGKRLWEVPADDVLAEMPDAYRTLFPRPGELAGLLCQRVWKDNVYGSLSSDGKHVFAVEDLGISLNNRSNRLALQGGRRVPETIWPKAYNRLAAYDIHSGKLVWHLGGSKEEYGLKLSGTFFLGAPLIVSERLYQLAEIGSEIRLFALEASSGDVLWSQRIAMLDRSILDNPIRRLAAVSPSYQNGVLVCPTSSGAIVGLKLARRSLLWGYRYKSSAMGRNVSRFGRIALTRTSSGSNTATQWVDGNLIVSGDRVLATPTDSKEIHCLDLLEGKLLWKKPQDDGLYLAAVWNNNAVLVGSKRVWAVSIDSGKPAWDGRIVKLPDGSVPSGLGVHAGELYYLPLSSAEVLAVDLKSGEIRQRLASRSGTVPGNLICYRDKIISQTIHGVAAFDQLTPLKKQIAQQLADKPDDVDALRQKARILLDADKRLEAVECLRHAYRVAPKDKCRSQLRRALIDGLRHEFSEYQSASLEIEKLIETPAQQIEYLCVMATGLESASRWKPALEHYMRLTDIQDVSCPMIAIDKSHIVRQERWLAASLKRFREIAPAEIVADLDRRLDRRLDKVMKNEKTEPLLRFADCFDGQPQSAAARRELTKRYLASKELLKAERLLRRRMRSSNPSEAATAILEWANVLSEAKLWKDVAACYREMEDRWGDTVCHEGKTGRQLVNSLPAESPVAELVHPERQWPAGAVRVAKQKASSTNHSYHYSYPVSLHEDRHSFFARHYAKVDYTGHKLTLSDSLGHEVWSLSVADSQTTNYSSRIRNHRLGASGHLMLLFSGEHRCVAIDTLSGPKPHILWEEDLTNPERHTLGIAGTIGRPWNTPWIPQMMVSRTSSSSRETDSHFPEVFTDEYTCRQRFQRCVALDPLSGQTLWCRRDVPTQCTLLGDSEHVFLVATNQSEATVLRAQDGKRLPGTRAVPDRQEWIATRGCKILRWYLKEGKRKLELFDPWAQKADWGPYTFSPEGKFDFLNNEAIGVIDPEGHFTMIALRDGKKIIDTQVEPEPKLREFFLFASEWGYTLVTNSRPVAQRPNQRRWRQLHGVTSKTIYKGRVYGFDLSGKPQWPSRPKGIPIENRQLLLEQPAALPVLAFAAQAYTSSGRHLNWNTSLLLIDKRTGRELVNKEYKERIQRLVFDGNLKEKTIRVGLPDGDLTLTCTDEPVAPENNPEAAADDDKSQPGGKKASTWEAILKSLKKMSRE